MARLWMCVGSLSLAFLLALPAIAEDKKDNKPEGKPLLQQPADEKTAAENTSADPYAVPNGSPKELKIFIEKILSDMPPNEETRDKMRKAVLQAAEKILSAKPDDTELDFAVGIKMECLEKPEDIKTFGEELKKAGYDKQARMVRGFTLGNDIKIAIMGGKEDLKSQINDILKFLREDPPQASDMDLAIFAGQVAELQEGKDYATDIYQQLSKIFLASKEDRLAEFGKRLEGVVRRLALVGNKMQLEGKLLSGETLDYSKYKGKVLLVDFWATWCGPCLAEIPNLKKVYADFHDKGFEIIGFSCDYSREELEKFLKEKEIPWAIVYGDKGDRPTVDYYGILGLPTMILIGKDGNVIQIDIRGEELNQKLEELLDPKKVKKDKEKTTGKTGPTG